MRYAHMITHLHQAMAYFATKVGTKPAQLGPDFSAQAAWMFRYAFDKTP
jgi:hypothetical protein